MYFHLADRDHQRDQDEASLVAGLKESINQDTKVESPWKLIGTKPWFRWLVGSKCLNFLDLPWLTDGD